MRGVEAGSENKVKDRQPMGPQSPQGIADMAEERPCYFEVIRSHRGERGGSPVLSSGQSYSRQQPLKTRRSKKRCGVE